MADLSEFWSQLLLALVVAPVEQCTIAADGRGGATITPILKPVVDGLAHGIGALLDAGLKVSLRFL